NAKTPVLVLPGLFFNFNGMANVINSSWGFDDPAGTDDITKVIDGFAKKFPGTTIVVAAGNFPTPPTPANSVTGPGSGDNVLSVGATQNAANNLSDFSGVAVLGGRGPGDYCDPVRGVVHGGGAAVDIGARGTSIVAAYYGGKWGGNGPTLPTPDPPNPATDLYNYPLAGTSFAAP